MDIISPGDGGIGAGPGPRPAPMPAPAITDERSESRLRALEAAARYHGVDLDRREFQATEGEAVPSPATLVRWVRGQGLWAKALRLRWRNLFRFQTGVPVILLLTDGTAAVLMGADQTRNIVWLKDPRTPAGETPMAVDELRLAQVWTGEAVLVRRERGASLDEEPFTLGWLAKLVFAQKKLMRDISIASIVLSVLTIVPPFLVMTVINKVLNFKSVDTLVLVSVILAVAMLFEAMLSYARREITQVVSARIDVKLNLHIFNRLLALPVEFFERNQTGATTHRLMQIFRVREFLTGRLMGTFLDSFTLFILMPFLFWLEPTLAWITLAIGVLIAFVILVFLPVMRRLISRTTLAEVKKGSVLVETVTGIRTVKSLALEGARREVWEERVAEAADWRLRAGRMANWPQTMVMPLEMFIQRGVLMVGAYLVVSGSSSVSAGGLIAFMLLGGRIAAPLVQAAKLMEDLEEVRSSIGEIGYVLNNPTETRALTTGMRPRFEGAIEVEDVTFTYPGGSAPALDHVSFSVPAGTMLGLVGRSGSGKSTVTRLLQGINRDYTGFLKIDGAELREINLAHLRRSFGVVMQDNFLFRGSVRDNITAGRPGLTLEDVVRAARLAGAEEFIERLPAGYDTWVEEGSANLSGGQKQRLAIARALIADPRIMILDEATSALDPESEALVNANLKRIATGRTMVIVSHRLTSLIDCDNILVLERGRVMDCAPHPVLLERCSVYRQLWRQQNRHLESPNSRGVGPRPMLAEGD